MKIVEVDNASEKAIWVMACRVKGQEKIYIHLAGKRKDLHSGIAKKIEKHGYAYLEINEVEY